MKVSTIIRNAITLTFFNLEFNHSFALLPQQTNNHKPLVRKIATATSGRYIFGGFFDDDSKIPKEHRAETYASEGQSKRMLSYSIFALFFFVLGASNIMLTTMKGKFVDLNEQGYG